MRSTAVILSYSRSDRNQKIFLKARDLYVSRVGKCYIFPTKYKSRIFLRYEHKNARFQKEQTISKGKLVINS
jgi:hypothetical protein